MELHFWLKQHEAVGASGPGFPPFSLRTVPNGLQTPPEQGVRDPAAGQGRSCRGMAVGGRSLTPPAASLSASLSAGTEPAPAGAPVHGPGSSVVRGWEVNSFESLL